MDFNNLGKHKNISEFKNLEEIKSSGILKKGVMFECIIRKNNEENEFDRTSVRAFLKVEEEQSFELYYLYYILNINYFNLVHKNLCKYAENLKNDLYNREIYDAIMSGIIAPCTIFNSNSEINKFCETGGINFGSQKLIYDNIIFIQDKKYLRLYSEDKSKVIFVYSISYNEEKNV